ncbi:hypothetical protein PV11_10052 [Exophiala sideris]|uniref:Uncharacterized protein n=1 Tax=Exophiala sideris TaxID=1016849 RepID=A0A0D1VQH0_9EURO|nr:hypothetical protein PV11_10052 [Exophiala sideris]
MPARVRKRSKKIAINGGVSVVAISGFGSNQHIEGNSGICRPEVANEKMYLTVACACNRARYTSSQASVMVSKSTKGPRDLGRTIKKSTTIGKTFLAAIDIRRNIIS